MSQFLKFSRAEHAGKFELTVWGDTLLLVFITGFTLLEGRFGLMPVPEPLNWVLLFAYAATVGFYWWSVRNWRAVGAIVLLAALMDNLAVAGVVWRFGGFGSFAAAGFLITLTVAILASGIRYSILYACIQLTLVVAMGVLEGEQILGQWLLLYVIFTLSLLGIPGAIFRWSRQRERELAEKTQALEAESVLLQESVEELARIGKAQIDALIRAERLAIIGELAPTIVHDLKNPLGALSSVAESAKETLTKLLEREPEGPHVEATAEVAEDLGVMRAQLRRLRDMVQSILNLSRQTEGYEEEFLVTDAAADALEAIALQVKDLPKIEVKREFAEAIPEARGNRGQLSQVMVNLLWNAVQALGEAGGTVALRARDGNGEIVIDVADSGHGVPPEAREKIFEPFYTTKEATHGTGLGLYLCKQIIERHGGRVEVGESDLGGALFRVVIPAAD